MKRKQLIALLVSISLVLVLVLSACAQQGGTTTPGATAGAAGDKVYRVLNPSAQYIPVETHGLAPRLDTLAGKNICYYESEANPVIMPTLFEKLKKDYPTTTWMYFETQNQGENSPKANVLAEAKAVIRGISW